MRSTERLSCYCYQYRYCTAVQERRGSQPVHVEPSLSIPRQPAGWSVSEWWTTGQRSLRRSADRAQPPHVYLPRWISI